MLLAVGGSDDENAIYGGNCHVSRHRNRWNGGPSPSRSDQATRLCCHRNGCNEPKVFLQRVCPRRRENNQGSGREISCPWRQACEHRGARTCVFGGQTSYRSRIRKHGKSTGNVCFAVLQRC